jgi:hypothetical protein
MRRPGEKPSISDSAIARLQMFHEERRKLEIKWGVEVAARAEGTLVYVDTEREDDFDAAGDYIYDASVNEDGDLEIETFDWWGK